MYFLNKDTGWLVGTTVTDNIMNIIRTYDGGKNWNEEFSSAAAYYKWKVEDITYSKDGTLCVCGYAGLASNRGEFILKRSLQTKPPVGIVKNTSIRSFKNYPNPFTEETTIKVEFPQQEDIELKVYNSLGQLVENIFQGSINPGTHLFQFEPSVSRAGFYFGVLKTKDESFTLKMNKSE